MREILAGYGRVERYVFYLIGAQFCLQLINSAFFILFNYFMEEEGYIDYEIADIVAERFLGVMLLAAPLGFFVRGKRLKPFFYVACAIVPTFSLLSIYAAENHLDTMLTWAMRGWGAGFVFLQVTGLPFILLNVKREHHSEAIAMWFQMWSATVFFAGIVHFTLNTLNPAFFDERNMLVIFSVFGYLSFYFISKIQIDEQLSDPIPAREADGLEKIFYTIYDVVRPYDWGRILSTLIPTLIIAIGAGFTIPVINLFFLNIHGIEADTFAIMSAGTYVMVAAVILFMPYIRRRFGYGVAITGFQSVAVLCLLVMATTEYYAGASLAAGVAVFFYMIRQPFMNAAGPMTSELTMYYVGERNQEMISALNASIWSGSWFVSMQLFAWMRQLQYRYVTIFLITVVMYAVGVGWYAYLIYLYNREGE